MEPRDEIRARPSLARARLITKSNRLQSRVGLYDSLGDGVTRQTSDVMNPQLVHHLLAMFLDGLDADRQL